VILDGTKSRHSNLLSLLLVTTVARSRAGVARDALDHRDDEKTLQRQAHQARAGNGRVGVVWKSLAENV
jgi:hypothetical protein